MWSLGGSVGVWRDCGSVEGCKDCTCGRRGCVEPLTTSEACVVVGSPEEEGKKGGMVGMRGFRGVNEWLVRSVLRPLVVCLTYHVDVILLVV